MNPRLARAVAIEAERRRLYEIALAPALVVVGATMAEAVRKCHELGWPRGRATLLTLAGKIEIEMVARHFEPGTLFDSADTEAFLRARFPYAFPPTFTAPKKRGDTRA